MSDATGVVATSRGTGVVMAEQDLTVAVTGPTGTFGFGLVPLLQADERVKDVVGIARRPFDPTEHGWTKMRYRRGDVRDEAALREAFAGADVVVHLAFLIVGGNRQTARAINVEGTLNAFRAAAAAGARRFVYASSVAAYGFHSDNPVGMTEDWPTRPADRLFYAQEKAELESLLQQEAAGHPELQLYLLRPPVVLGPHTVGGKDLLPGPLAPLGRTLGSRFRRLPVPLPTSSSCTNCSGRSGTRTTSAARCCSASWRPGRPVPTTSPATACCRRSTSRARSASSRCRCRRGRRTPPPAHWRGCRSSRPSRSGW
ncbi:MAG TPA: NAD-dependent epimerase/dehydratase family protein, partial [Mycobacteriales bacterium]|nr:NAD-dependent epimerase/dehydratase family protein [Mycobacteriales bacterium]